MDEFSLEHMPAQFARCIETVGRRAVLRGISVSKIKLFHLPSRRSATLAQLGERQVYSF